MGPSITLHPHHHPHPPPPPHPAPNMDACLLWVVINDIALLLIGD